jgi:hypothetical protein
MSGISNGFKNLPRKGHSLLITRQELGKPAALPLLDVLPPHSQIETWQDIFQPSLAGESDLLVLVVVMCGHNSTGEFRGGEKGLDVAGKRLEVRAGVAAVNL